MNDQQFLTVDRRNKQNHLKIYFVIHQILFIEYLYIQQNEKSNLRTLEVTAIKLRTY